MIRYLLWDWNGTLLDDARIGLSVMNVMLRRYGKPLLSDVNRYREIFGFPVIDYYERAGLGKELFPTLSHEWMAEYMRQEPACGLREGAEALLSAFRADGIRQYILSASQVDNLNRQLSRFSIAEYFDEVLGLSHIYATGKENIAQDWMKRTGADSDETLFVGDTLHDAEVARLIGCRCVLVCGGHQSRTVLETAGYPVAEDLAGVRGCL